VLAQGGKAQIKNVAPSIFSVTLSPDADASLSGVQVNPTPGSTSQVTVSIQVKDSNGHSDVTSVSVVVYKPDASTVHVPSAAATFSSGTGANSYWTSSFSMNYYDTSATDDSAYKVMVVATDTSGATADNSASPATFNYTELVALSLSTSLLDFGALAPGETSAPIKVNGINSGNKALDVLVGGTSLVAGSHSIPVSRVDVCLDSGCSNPIALSNSSQALSSFDLGAGPGSSKPQYFRLRVPTADEQAVPPGIYQGTISILATTSQ
jgi:hypothetical protein